MIAKRKKGKRKDPRKGVPREIYNIPDALDNKLLQNKIDGFCESLNEDGSPIKPITENDLKQIIRNGVRERWMRCDTKLAFLHLGKEPDLDLTSRTRYRIRCNMCGDHFKEPEIEIDHKEGEKSFTRLEDALDWANSILNVKFKELQRLCKSCHKLKSRCESAGVSLEEGKIVLQIDEICRGSGCPEKQWLKDRGVTPASNKEKRKAQVKELLLRED